MTLLHLDGFEGVDVAMKPGWSTATATAATGRNGGGVDWRLGSKFLNFTPSATIVLGFAGYLPTLVNETGGTSQCVSIYGDSNVTNHLTLNWSSTGTLTLRRGTGSGTVIASSAAGVLIAASWFYLEIKATIADAGGSCIVRVNGSEVINYSGDTRNGGTSTNIDAIRFTAAQSFNSIMDDLYVLNGLGTTNNDWLGDVKVERLFPNGNGASSDWVGTDGNSVDNYQMVDESPANTTDYVSSATVGARELYEFGNLATASGDVLGVQTVLYAQKSDAGTASIKTTMRSSGGTVLAGSTQALGDTWSSFSSAVREIDADGSPWSISDVNSHQFGVEVA